MEECSAFYLLCAVQMPLGHSVELSSPFLGCVKDIVTMCTSQTCCLRVIIIVNVYESQNSVFAGECWNSCKCALLALPLSYWDVLFMSLTSSPKPITF